MAQPRALALSQIGTLASPMEKIRIAHTHSITPAPAWLLPAYKAVCEAGRAARAARGRGAGRGDRVGDLEGAACAGAGWPRARGV